MTEPTSRPGKLRERLALRELEYRIPPIANRLRYMLGGLTFIGILVLVATGIVMDQFYNPAPVGAHDSIIYLMTRVPLGQWVRSLHYWSATFVTVSIVAHLAYVFWRRSYQRPREVTWWAGVALALVLFGLVFTGTVLRGDQEGSEALAHAVEGARLVGWPGAILTPDFTRSVPLLSRMHNLHVSVLPIVLFAVIGLHFWLVRYHGIHDPEPKAVPFTHHLRRLTGFGLLLFGLFGLVAALAPPGLGYPGIEGTEVTKPFWPFLWIYSVENASGLWGMLLAPLVLFGFLALVPLLDRFDSARPARPRWVSALALLVLVLWLGGIIYGVFAPQMQHII